MTHQIYTLAQRPDLWPQIGPIQRKGWPEFMRNDPVANQYFGQIYELFPDCQLMLCNENDTVLATGNCLPLFWDGTIEGLPGGWDDELEKGVTGHNSGVTPNTLGALAITIDLAWQGTGLSHQVLAALRLVAKARGFQALIAPVRPSHKSRYPLTPIERYAQWTQPDGAPFDPWLRVHRKAGAEIMAYALKSMVITGTVADWEDWTKMRLPDSGIYVVPDALVPITIDREHDTGRYEEPNVWMRHKIAS